MAGDTKAVLEAVQNVAAATGRPVYVLLGQRTPCALDEVLALPNVCAVARGPREDEGVAVFAEGSAPIGPIWSQKTVVSRGAPECLVRAIEERRRGREEGHMTAEKLQAIEGRHADDEQYGSRSPDPHEDRDRLLAEVRRLRECLTRLTTGADCPACGHPYWRHRWDDALGQYLHPRPGPTGGGQRKG